LNLAGIDRARVETILAALSISNVGQLGSLGASAATPAILERLAVLLHDPDPGVRSYVAEATGVLGVPAVTVPIVSGLVRMLGEPESELREESARALVNLAAVDRAGIETILNALRIDDGGLAGLGAQALRILPRAKGDAP
jgi:HEAT repeat protein